MATVLTIAGENLIALKQAQGKVLNIDRFVLAHIPDMDPDQAVDRGESMPDPEYIVHEHDIPQEHKGYINPNQVVYSMLLTSDVGDFTFNWVGLCSSEDNTIVAITHLPDLDKYKSDTGAGTLGNNMVRNIMLEFTGAQGTTNVTVEASTWQIDFTVRLKGIDERERLSNRDIYGAECFFDDAYLVVNNSGAFSMQPGVAYVEGIRINLTAAQVINGEHLPKSVYLDVSMQPQGSDVVAVATPVFEDTPDYVDDINAAHYLTKIAEIAADGTVTDFRGKNLGGVIANQESVDSLQQDFTTHTGNKSNPHETTINQAATAGNKLETGIEEPYFVIADADSPAIDLTTRNRFVWTLGADRTLPAMAPTFQGEWHLNVYPNGNEFTLDEAYDGLIVGEPDPEAIMTRVALIYDGVSLTVYIDNKVVEA